MAHKAAEDFAICLVEIYRLALPTLRVLINLYVNRFVRANEHSIREENSENMTNRVRGTA
jgi:hypothetical protein